MKFRTMLLVSAPLRQGAAISAGDEVEVEVELDTAPREVAVPPDLAAALDHEPAARRAFDALSYGRERRSVLPIEGAKTAETRAWRIAKAVAELGAGRR
jgi:uncharacterized protein YdeI (YjbR/CyaY-like superfamily)